MLLNFIQILLLIKGSKFKPDFFFFLIYLAACGTQDLCWIMQDLLLQCLDSLVVAGGLQRPQASVVGM